MTFKERLKLDNPEYIQPYYGGDCLGCPENYGYEPEGRNKHCDRKCTECWNREMPETKKEEPTMKKIYYVATNIRESAFDTAMSFTLITKVITDEAEERKLTGWRRGVFYVLCALNALVGFTVGIVEGVTEGITEAIMKRL